MCKKTAWATTPVPRLRLEDTPAYGKTIKVESIGKGRSQFTMHQWITGNWFHNEGDTTGKRIRRGAMGMEKMKNIPRVE